MPNLLSAFTLNVSTPVEGTSTAVNSLMGGEITLNSETYDGGAGFAALFSQSMGEASAHFAQWIELDGEALPELPLTLPLAGNLLPQGELAETAGDETDPPLFSLQEWLAAMPAMGVSTDTATLEGEGVADSLPLTLEGGKRQPSIWIRYGAMATSMSTGAETTEGAASDADGVLTTVFQKAEGQLPQSRGAVLDQAIAQAMLGERTPKAAVFRSGEAGEGLIPLTQTTVAAPVAASPTSPVPGSGAAAPTLTVDVPMGQKGWNDAIGEKVSWMFQSNQSNAQVRLNPAHLGPMEVRVAMSNDQANVTFTVQHPATAEQLESALPRLREMLAESGLQLGQFDVRQQGQDAQERTAGGESTDFDLEGGSAVSGDDVNDSQTGRLVSGDGLLDTYA